MTERANIRSIQRPTYFTRLTKLLLVVALALYWLLARLLEEPLGSSLPLIVQRFLTAFPLFDLFAPAIDFLFGFFRLRVLRHLIPLVVGFYFARTIAVDTVEKLYYTPSRDHARRLLQRLMGMRFEEKPLALDRRRFVEMQQEYELLRVGGPGAVNITESDVAVTEINGRFSRTLGGGKHRLRRFERVVDLFDLREQEAAQSDVTLQTREGLPLTTDLHMVFRIRREPDREETDFAFDSDAVRQIAYAQTVVNYKVMRWDQMPMTIAIGQMRQLLAHKRLDELLDPNEVYSVAPQPELQQQFQARVKQILNGMGIELISVAYTSLHFGAEMRATMMKYWSAFGAKAKMLDPAPQGADTDYSKVAEKRARERMISSLTAGLKIIRERNTAAARKMSYEPLIDGDGELATQMLNALQMLVTGRSESPQPPQRTISDPRSRQRRLPAARSMPDDQQVYVLREQELRTLIQEAVRRSRDSDPETTNE